MEHLALTNVDVSDANQIFLGNAAPWPTRRLAWQQVQKSVHLAGVDALGRHRHDCRQGCPVLLEEQTLDGSASSVFARSVL